MAATALSLRPATLDDAPTAADALSVEWLDEPVDPVITRHHWSVPFDGREARFLVEREGLPVGYCEWRHDDWDRVDRRFALLDAARLPGEGPELLAEMVRRMEEASMPEEPQFFSFTSREGNEVVEGVLSSLGYRHDRAERVWQLDLAANAERLRGMRSAALGRLAAWGGHVVTLADRESDAELLQRLWKVSWEGELDVPSTVPVAPELFDAFVEELRSPGTPWDRIFVALDEADEVLGMSFLEYPPVRGNVWTNWTTTARSARGRGVARALKLETVVQALELGVPFVRTGNDQENAPILHLNEELGYRRVPGFLTWMKEA